MEILWFLFSFGSIYGNPHPVLVLSSSCTHPILVFIYIILMITASINAMHVVYKLDGNGYRQRMGWCAGVVKAVYWDWGLACSINGQPDYRLP